MKLKVNTKFLYSHDQITVTTYEVGEQEVPEDAAEYALLYKLADEPAAKPKATKAK
jgi:hypothetical protein